MQPTLFLPFASLASLATATPAPRPTTPQKFYVTDFSEICTKSLPPQCAFSFNITVDNVPGQPGRSCSFRDTETDYVVCGIGIPEQSFSAYVEKSASGDARPGKLRAKFTDMLTQNRGYTVFGKKTLKPNIGESFSFPVVAKSAYA